MKRVIVTCALFLCSASWAQDFGRMNQQAQKMQACMAKIDMAEVEKLRVKAEAASAEIQALCDAGKRDEALSAAIRLGRELQSEPVMKDMQDCSEMLQDMPAFAWQQYEAAGGESKDICDSM